MRIHYYFFSSLMILILLLVSCVSPVGEKSSHAYLHIRLTSFPIEKTQESKVKNRSILPTNSAITHYLFIARNSSQNNPVTQSSTSGTFKVELPCGNWDIEVQGLSVDEKVLAIGTSTISLNPGEERQLSITLYPIEGEGELSLSWTVEGNIGTEAEIIFELEGSRGYEFETRVSALQNTFSPLKIPAGSYILRAHLIHQEKELCGFTESLLILANLQTSVQLVFSPPVARLGLVLRTPIFLGKEVHISPLRRVAAPSIPLLFKLDSDNIPAGSRWFLEGHEITANNELTKLRINNILIRSSPYRLDWVGNLGALADSSASASILIRAAVILGPLSWAEKIYSSDLGNQTARLSFDNCRDIAVSDDSHFVAIIGKNKQTLGIFEYEGPGSLSPAAAFLPDYISLLQEPVRVLFIPNEHRILLLCRSSGSILELSFNSENLNWSISQSISYPSLVGANNFSLYKGRWLYITNPEANKVLLMDIKKPNQEVIDILFPKEPDMQNFSRPSSIAISENTNTLTIGTLGDDSLYFYNINNENGDLLFKQKITKTSSGNLASLSDPVDMIFTKEGNSLLVASYYGKALLRFDLNPLTNLFEITRIAKNGQNGISGFNSPQRLAISPDNRYVVLTATGTNDGITLFSIESGNLSWQGMYTCDEEFSNITKPTPIVWEKKYNSCLIGSGSEGEKSLLLLKSY